MYNKLQSTQKQVTTDNAILHIGKTPLGYTREIVYILLNNTLDEPQRITIYESDYANIFDVYIPENIEYGIQLSKKEILSRATKYSRLLDSKEELCIPLHVAPSPKAPIFGIKSGKYIAIVPEKGVIDAFIQYIDI